MKPIGYYVSVPKDHSDHQALEKIEQEFGSTLESVHRFVLNRVIVHCVNCCHGKQDISDAMMKTGLGGLIAKLTPETAFDLVPFLHQVITARSEPKK